MWSVSDNIRDWVNMVRFRWLRSRAELSDQYLHPNNSSGAFKYIGKQGDLSTAPKLL